VYDQNLAQLLKGSNSEMSLAKMTEEAFALLNDEADVPDAPLSTAAVNPLYFSNASK
jgi:hypothetical protein